MRIAREANRALRQVRRVDVVVDDLGGKPLGVPAHALHQRRTLQPLDIARPIVDLGGGHQLAALLDAGDQQRRAVGPRGVDRGAVAGGAGAQDDEAAVPGSRHCIIVLCNGVARQILARRLVAWVRVLH